MSRLTAAFTATSVTAPITPPIREVSLPMIAFCTTLDSRKITATSNVFMLASPRLPVSRNSTAIRAYTITVRRIFSASGICSANIACHTAASAVFLDKLTVPSIHPSRPGGVVACQRRDNGSPPEPPESSAQARRQKQPSPSAVPKNVTDHVIPRTCINVSRASGMILLMWCPHSPGEPGQRALSRGGPACPSQRSRFSIRGAPAPARATLTFMAATVDERLAQVFVELADTLVAGFDLMEFLQTLTERCVELLGVDAAGLLLADSGGALRLVAASTEQARVMELFQIQNDEGPCLDCYRTGQVVIISDIGAEQALARWPRFAAAAREVGFAGVHAIPMRLRDQGIGTLNLFRGAVNGLDPAVARAARALVDVATIGMLQERAGHQKE